MGGIGTVTRRFGAVALGLVTVLTGFEAFARERTSGARPVTVHRLTGPHRARQRVGDVAAPLDLPLGPGGLYVRTPFQVVFSPEGRRLVRIPPYQGPDGTYESQADLVQAINGVPCGQDCTAASIARWGFAPAE